MSRGSRPAKLSKLSKLMVRTPAAKALGSKGGAARATKMTPEQRSEIAHKAAEERWAKTKQMPKATHGATDRPLKIGDAEIACNVLEDRRRVLSIGGMIKAPGMSGAGSGEGDRLA